MNRRGFLKALATAAVGLTVTLPGIVGSIEQELLYPGWTGYYCTGYEAQLLPEDFQERFINPAIEQLANDIDRDGLELFMAERAD